MKIHRLRSAHRVVVRTLLLALTVTGLQIVTTGTAAADPAGSHWAELRMC